MSRPSHRRFGLTLLVCAAVIVALAVTGTGGFPLLAVGVLVTLGTVDACFRSFDARHRATTLGRGTAAP